MPRRDQLEALLADEPNDVFLNYALAMQLISEGETDAGLARMESVRRLDPNYVAAYFQSAQTLARIGDTSASRDLLRVGIERASAIGDQHAAGEMSGLLAQLES